ncbi:MAG: tRNA preQ1(34) S-adenosylmethionine ribosyltransferase-isomerase QueA [Firmicutes bacterium]|nr:tRNA preQ1(34) S-adenosylmethionine ribosyltransferase-isomerase QueA [Bacillota bacterium]
MNTSDFDYELPEELIAQEPLEKRDESKLMVLKKDTGEIQHRTFKDLPEYLDRRDMLVINDTRVIPARLIGTKEGTGARVEMLLLTRKDLWRWETLVRPGRRVHPGARIVFGDGLLECRVLDRTESGGRLVEFACDGPFEEILDRVGSMPLPPYIKKPLTDRNRYQTVYARREGSAAAPTAGLHFTPELLEKIRSMGVVIAPLLLHVGLGTFRPVQVEDIRRHRMHEEYYEVGEETARAVAATRRRGGRVVAVGTTAARCLESAAGDNGLVRPGSGWTGIFIYPGYRFKVVDALITNFHLPKSTLIMMVSALAGREKILAAYREAVRMRYRFFSFGDAMFIL